MKQKNLMLLIVAAVFLMFIFSDIVVIFCEGSKDLSVFQQFSDNLGKYFTHLTYEKGVKDSYSVLTTTSWYAACTLASFFVTGAVLQTCEYAWNGRYLMSKFLYNYTPLGIVDNGTGKTKEMLDGLDLGLFKIKFENTAGPLKWVVDNVSYEEFWILHKAKNFMSKGLLQKDSNLSTPTVIYKDQIVPIIRTQIIYQDHKNLKNIKDNLEINSSNEIMK